MIRVDYMHTSNRLELRWRVVLLSLFLAGLLLPPAARSQFVIVVPKSSCIDSLSMKELEGYFKGSPVKPCSASPTQIVEFSPASEKFYQKLYGVSSYSIGKHWLRQIFSGERVLPPKSVHALEAFIAYMQKYENTIGFLPREIFVKGKKSALRAVVIEGHTYRDPDYALRDGFKKE